MIGGGRTPHGQTSLGLDLMRRGRESAEDRKKRTSLSSSLPHVSAMELLSALGSTVLASTVGLLRESAEKLNGR